MKSYRNKEVLTGLIREVQETIQEVREVTKRTEGAIAEIQQIKQDMKVTIGKITVENITVEVKGGNQSE
jgi:hypothetical protein